MLNKHLKFNAYSTKMVLLFIMNLLWFCTHTHTHNFLMKYCSLVRMFSFENFRKCSAIFGSCLPYCQWMFLSLFILFRPLFYFIYLFINFLDHKKVIFELSFESQQDKEDQAFFPNKQRAYSSALQFPGSYISPNGRALWNTCEKPPPQLGFVPLSSQNKFAPLFFQSQ